MRIGAHILGFERQLVNRLNSANASGQESILRLATRQRINFASDDPAAFMALSQHQRQLSVVNASIKNVNRASNIVSEVQSSLSQIRDQINIIRDAVLDDMGGQLTAGQRAIKQTEIDEALYAIDTIANSPVNGRQLLNKIKSDVVGTGYVTDVSTLNATQVQNLQVNSIADGTSVILSGNVTAANQAELTYQGATGATVQSSATFSVTGSLGAGNITVTQGESLVAVRDRVNQESANTGVAASLSGDNLVFNSIETGAGAHIEVQALSVEQNANVSGVNPLHFSSFQVDSMNPTSSIVLEGDVKDRAEQAQLKYDSDNGKVKEDATFTLAGNLGSTSITVFQDENITGVRDRINQETANTGVVASIQNDDIIFNSIGYGDSKYVYIEETSGEFQISGGQGAGDGKVDYGKNAKTEINGTDYFGNGNSYSNLTIGPGTFTFDIADEFQGDFDDVTITSTAGSFTITGGNGDGTADGTDPAATINGQHLTPAGTEFTFSEGSGDFTIEFVDGFSGAIEPITVSNTHTDVVAITGDDNTLSFSLFGDNATSSFSVGGVSTAGLGGMTGSLSDLITGGSKSGLDGNAADALAIADEALAELDLIEAGVNGFSNAILASATAHNAAMKESLEESIAQIQHVDEAEESALLSRSLLLAENAQGAMSVLWQQRHSMVSMLMRNAGLR